MKIAVLPVARSWKGSSVHWKLVPGGSLDAIPSMAERPVPEDTPRAVSPWIGTEVYML
jgi:hypothetical protein